MSALATYFKNINDIFWGSNFYEWWFYLSVVLILAFEKHRTRKVIFGLYSFVFIIGIFNPVSYTIMQMINPMWQYYVRLFSMLPYPYCIFLCTISLIDRLSKAVHRRGGNKRFPLEQTQNLLRLSFVSCVCFFIIHFGNNVYHESWMRPAENLSKVQMLLSGFAKRFIRTMKM